MLIKDLLFSAFREPQLPWVYGKVYDLWILRVQNKVKIYFKIEMCMLIVMSYST
jgi:hypothetical protein